MRKCLGSDAPNHRSRKGVRLPILLSLLVAASRLAAGAGAGPEPARPLSRPAGNLEEVIVVFKSHFDIGYTHLAREVVQGYRTTVIDHALEVVDQNRNLPAEQQFVWTIPGWPMKKILEDWPGQTAQRQARVRAAFREGRFVAHALPFSMQTEMLEPECLVRGLGFASQLARDAGKPLPAGAKMTDVPCHSWILPTVLRHAGVSFLHIGCNGACTPPRVPPLFWWEGPDGSRLLTMYSPAYGSGELPPDNWPHQTWLALLMRGDNAGPPSPGELKDVIERIRRALPGVKVRVGTLGDFGDRMLSENPPLPVIRADMPDTWIHGPMCDPAGVILQCETMPAIAATESLHTLLGAWQVPAPEVSAAIAGAYENGLLYYEHTWGGAMYWIARYLPPKDGLGRCEGWDYGEKWKAGLAAGRFDRLMESWEEHSSYALTANKLIRPLLREELRALARSVNAPGPRTVVFNALPWPRDGVPALGYRTEAAGTPPPPGAPAADASSGTLENDYFKVILAPARGAIQSLVDKRTGRELVDDGAAHGFGQFLYERFSANEIAKFARAYVRPGFDWAYAEVGKPNLPPAAEFPYRALTPANCSLELRRDGTTATLEMRSDSVGFPVATRVLLRQGAPYVDLELTVEKPADPWPEAGWVCLPFKVAAPQFRLGRHGSIMDPATDIVPGANRHFYAVGSGVAVFDPLGRGVGVCGLDTPLVSLGEPGCWKFDFDYVPTQPSVYYNLFNNQWSTNYRLWNEGRWTYRFRIWAFEKYAAATALITPALEARYPLQTATLDAPAGHLPPSQSGLSVSRPGVLVTAFGPNPDGPGVLLRVWEQAGGAGALVVTLPGGFKTATPVNLRGEKTGKPGSIQSGRLAFDLPAFAPASYVLQ